MRPREILESYQVGLITQLELISQLIRCVGRGGQKALDEFVANVTGAVLARVLEDVKNSPWDNEEWDKRLVLGSYCGSAASGPHDKIWAENTNKILAENRAGIETLRVHYEINSEK